MTVPRGMHQRIKWMATHPRQMGHQRPDPQTGPTICWPWYTHQASATGSRCFPNKSLPSWGSWTSMLAWSTRNGWPDECSSLTVVACIVCSFPQSLLVVLDASFCTETVLSLRKQVWRACTAHTDGRPMEDCKDPRHVWLYHEWIYGVETAWAYI